MMGGYYGLIDFGSTYTKICIVDPEDCRIAAWSQAPTTVATDITLGLEEALSRLDPPISFAECRTVRATSSAAGGLRMVAMGLVPELTAEAANRAALGAGAKVLRVFSYRLTDRELRLLDEIQPDIALLAGGTDGGNGEVILHNARRLAQVHLGCPVVVAGNKEMADEVESILAAAGYPVYIAENVMPEIGKLAVDAAREKIREVFLAHIVRAKGLDKAKTLVDEIIMPTPLAILKAATLLAEGTARQKGLGEVVVADVGGATTDIHSAATGNPTDPGVVLKGLPEPFAKRTVEGDLGIRLNAPTIYHLAKNALGTAGLFAKYERAWAENKVNFLAAQVKTISEKSEEKKFDLDLARAAVAIAMNRHAGHLETFYTFSGAVQVQMGKDLTEVRHVIGTGGIFAYGAQPEYILEGAKRQTDPLILKPEKPQFLIDRRYILFAAGLLLDLDPELALEIMKRNLTKVEETAAAL